MSDEQLLAAVENTVTVAVEKAVTTAVEKAVTTAVEKAVNTAVEKAVNTAVEKAVNKAVEAMKVDLLEHIHAVGGQLHTQMQEIMDRQDARLERQAGLIQGGSRAIVRMVEWTETADTTLSRYDRRLAEFERRLDQIEKAGK